MRQTRLEIQRKAKNLTPVSMDVIEHGGKWAHRKKRANNQQKTKGS